jgi:hypothetical protein
VGAATPAQTVPGPPPFRQSPGAAAGRPPGQTATAAEATAVGRIGGFLRTLAAATDDPVRKKQKSERGAAAAAAATLTAPEPGSCEAARPLSQRLRAFARRHIAAVAFFALWALVLAFPYFGLGPASFVVLHDTSEMNLPRAVWYGAEHAQTGMGVWSPMGISGTDRLASGLSRDLDTFLFTFLPGWLAYGLFMWLQRFIAGFFLYRLLRDWRDVSPAAAACVSCAYALFTQPHINMGWTGFALYDGLALPGLPLVLYLLFRCERWRPRYRYPVIALAGVLFALGSHFFLALFCVGVAVIVSMGAFPHRDRRFFWAAPLVFAAAWFAGELPVLWAAAVNAAGSQRADHALLTLNTQGGVAYRQWLPKFLADNALALILAAAAFVLAVLRRAWRVLVVASLAGLCLVLVAYAPFFRDSVFAHLGPLSGFRFDRLFVVLPFLALFAGGLGLGLLPRSTPALGFGSLGRPAGRRRNDGPAGESAGEAEAAEATGVAGARATTGAGGTPVAAGPAPPRERTVVAAEVSVGGNGDGQPDRVFVLTRTERVEVAEHTGPAGARDVAAEVPVGGTASGAVSGAAAEGATAPAAAGVTAEGAAAAMPAAKGGRAAFLLRRHGLPIQAVVGLAILVAVVVQMVGVQRRVVGEMAGGATYATLYGSPDITALAARQEGSPPFRVASINAPLAKGELQTWHPGFAWAYGLETADGYSVLYSQRYQDFWLRVIDAKIGRSDEIKDYYRRWGNRVYLFASRNYLNRPGGIEAARRWNLDLLSLANVRYFISPVQLRDAGFTLLPSTRRREQLAWGGLSGWQKTTRAWGGEFPGLPLYIYENRNVFPRAFVVARVKVGKTAGAVLDEMAAADRATLRGTVFLTVNDRAALGLDRAPLGGADAGGGQATAAQDPAAAGSVRVVSYGADEVVLRVRAARRGVVVLANSYNGFWRAWVDGRETPVAPADHAFLGAVVPAGRHDVVFKYQPPYRLLAWQ